MAEEVLQETFIRVWNYRSKLVDVLEFDPWVYRVARNVFLTKLKRQPTKTEALDLILHDSYYSDMGYDQPEYKELEYAFEEAISYLMLRAGVTYGDFTFGAGANLDQYGPFKDY